jgi:hypothetical protein
VIVSYEVVEIEALTGPGRAEECLGRLAVASPETPAILLPQEEGRTGMDTVQELCSAATRRRGFLAGASIPFGEYDLGWHVDERPDDGDMLSIVAWRGHVGIAQAHIVVPKPDFWLLTPSNYVVPQQFLDAAELGQADDSLVVPVMHTATVEADDVLVFNIGGPYPSIHNFTSATPVRQSFSHIGNFSRSVQ